MAAELIPSAIEKQVGPYMANHGLRRDKMLLEYVKVNCFRCVGSLFSGNGVHLETNDFKTVLETIRS